MKDTKDIWAWVTDAQISCKVNGDTPMRELKQWIPECSEGDLVALGEIGGASRKCLKKKQRVEGDCSGDRGKYTRIQFHRQHLSAIGYKSKCEGVLTEPECKGVHSQESALSIRSGFNLSPSSESSSSHHSWRCAWSSADGPVPLALCHQDSQASSSYVSSAD